MSYFFIYLVFALIMAIAGGTALFFSWKICQTGIFSSRQLWAALTAGFVLWFFLGILLVLQSEQIKKIAIDYFSGNGFSFSFIFSMICVLLHHQLLQLFKK